MWWFGMADSPFVEVITRYISKILSIADLDCLTSLMEEYILFTQKS